MGRLHKPWSGLGMFNVDLTASPTDKSRYTMFYPLYPIGIGAEWWLMYRSIEPVGKVSPVLPPVFYFLLALYAPGKRQAHMSYRLQLTHIQEHIPCSHTWSSKGRRRLEESKRQLRILEDLQTTRCLLQWYQSSITEFCLHWQAMCLLEFDLCSKHCSLIIFYL
jgi:hypothetical protein